MEVHFILKVVLVMTNYSYNIVLTKHIFSDYNGFNSRKVQK